MKGLDKAVEREEMVLYPGCRDVTGCRAGEGVRLWSLFGSREPHDGLRQHLQRTRVRFPKRSDFREHVGPGTTNSNSRPRSFH